MKTIKLIVRFRFLNVCELLCILYILYFKHLDAFHDAAKNMLKPEFCHMFIRFKARY